MTDPEQPAPDAKPETQPRAAPQQAQKTPIKRRRWPWIGGVLAILFLGGIASGLYFLPVIRDHLPMVDRWLSVTPEPDPQRAALLARLDGLERDLAALRRDVERHSTAIGRLETEDSRLATGIARVEALVQTLAEASRAAPPAPAPGPETSDTESTRPEAPTPERRDDGALAARLDMLMLRMSQLESAFVPLSEKVARQEGAEAQRAALAARTETLTGRIEALENRLRRLEEAASADAKQALLVLSYSALRRAAEAGRPIDAELRALADLAERDSRAGLQPALERLGALSATHPPTVSALKERFPAVVHDILDAARLPDGANWWQRLWARLTGLVTVRRTGEIAGDDPAAIVARAEARLADGNVAGAVAALERLTGPAAGAAEGWLAAARQRLALDAALDDVENSLRAMTVQGTRNGDHDPDGTPAPSSISEGT